MAEVDTLSTPTANYGWLKPDIGGDNDNWGAELNGDLDAIDAKVHSIETNFSATAPQMDGTAAPGSAATFARSDHIHPTDTSRYAASNPSGFITAAGAPVQSFNTRTGAITLNATDVTGALGYTPYSNANPAAYITAAGAPVQSVAGKTGAVTLAHGDITDWASLVPVSNAALPQMDGTAATGTAGTYAREGHVHPTDTSRAPLASPAFTGVPTTASTPSPGDSSTKLATTAFVAAAVANPNRLDNGDMSVNQRGLVSTAITSNTAVPPVDRWWAYAAGTTSYFTAGQNYGGITPQASFPNYLGAQSTVVHTLAAADFFMLMESLELANILDLQWGTAGAQPATLSFWAYASVAGTYSGSVSGANSSATGNPATRSFVFSFALTANTWTYVTVPITGDQSGVWNQTNSDAALQVAFALGMGSTYSAATGWNAGEFFGVTGTTNLLAATGRKFAVTGVKLELGNAATPFVFEPVSVRLKRCARYFRRIGGYAAYDLAFGAYNAANAMCSMTMTFEPMWGTPTVTEVGTFTLTNCTNMGYNASPTTVMVNLKATATGAVNWANSSAAGIYLAVSAEI